MTAYADCAREGCANRLTGRQVKYCSRACGGRQKELPTAGVCAECGIAFEFPSRHVQRFCSRSCAATFTNRGKVRSTDPVARARRRIIERQNGCWHYDGAHRAGTQPRPHITSNGATLYVYRLLWEDLHGPIPAGRELHHTCVDYRCVNPAHGVLLTAGDHRRVHAALRAAA